METSEEKKTTQHLLALGGGRRAAVWVGMSEFMRRQGQELAGRQLVWPVLGASGYGEPMLDLAQKQAMNMNIEVLS